MAYLSRIWLHPLRTGAQKLLNSPQAMHATVLYGLSRQPVTERVLWRLETDNPHRISVLVLTESKPSWEHIIEQAGWVDVDEPQFLIRPYQPLLDKVVLGREFTFRLKANPVTSTRKPLKLTPAQQRRLDEDNVKRGFRVAHRTAAHQLEWLTGRLDQWGFSIVSETAVQLVARQRLVFDKDRANGQSNKDRVVLHTATFDGRVRVSDPELARRSLLHGVGPAKAYGCGLITLAPAGP